MIDIDKTIEVLSDNLDTAIKAGETQLALALCRKISQLIKYSTNIED